MSKYCGKCGLKMTDDDFLCPRCGAIWGDRVYRVPTVPEAQEPDTEETESPDEPQEVQQKKQPRWLLPVTAGCLLLAFVLFLIGSDWDLWAGEGSTSPSTTEHSTVGAGPTTAPPETLPAYITYTVKIEDPFGHPVPNVTLSYPNTNPFASSRKVWQITDSDGTVSFQFPSSMLASVQIEEVPEDYTLLSDSTFYFKNGATDLVIILHFDYKISIDPVLRQSYSVTMQDPAWLYEELRTGYAAGEVVNVKIISVGTDLGYMMFMNGVEIPEIPLDGGPYRLYQFIMPEEDVVLDLKIIEDRTYDELLKSFYRQYTDAEQISVLQYYGKYASGAEVVILDYPFVHRPDENTYDDIVSDYLFLYPGSIDIRVLKDGRFYALPEAYIRGYVTDAEVKQIYKQHSEAFAELYTNASVPIPE